MQNSAPPQGPGAEGEAQGKKREAGVRGLVGGVAPAILSVAYLAGMLILPVLALLSRAVVIPPGDFWRIATQPVALSAYTVTLSMAVCATLFNGFFGFLLAWVLSRYEFPGRKVRSPLFCQDLIWPFSFLLSWLCLLFEQDELLFFCLCLRFEQEGNEIWKGLLNAWRRTDLILLCLQTPRRPLRST